MWPFTSRRIMGNRWWALAFVVFVCWQAIEITGSSLEGSNSANTAADEQDARDTANALNAM